MAWLRKPSSFRAHETGIPFKAGYFRFARHSPTTYETFSGVASDSATSGRPVCLSAPHDITRCVEPSLVVRARRATPVAGTP
jgi:hypothetical protein